MVLPGGSWLFRPVSDLVHEADCLYRHSINSYSASHDNLCTVGGDGGCRVGEVRAGTTSPHTRP